MNAKTFKTVLLGVLFVLHLMCSAPLVVGQTTTSGVPAETLFPSVLPIGTNMEQKLRAFATRIRLGGVAEFEVDGVREYLRLRPASFFNDGQAEINLGISPRTSDDDLIAKALPYINDIVADGNRQLNDRIASGMPITFAFGRIMLDLAWGENNPAVCRAVGYRYFLPNEEGIIDAPAFVPDELEIVPAYVGNSDSLEFEFGLPIIPAGHESATITGVLLDARDSNGNEDTSSSYTDGQRIRVDNYAFRLPVEVVNGSYTGTMYIEFSTYRFAAGQTAKQVLAVDLQTGRISRPKLAMKSVSIRGPLNIAGVGYYVRPKCLMPRGTTFRLLSSTTLAGPWKYEISKTSGAGDAFPLVEFEPSIFVRGEKMGFVKVLIDDGAYPDFVQAVLPPE